MLKTILIFSIVISILVLIHETGHFLAAKLFKVKVEEFGIGMFIRLFSFKKKETVYSINALPIGGYVKLMGEDGGNENDPRSFSSKSKRKRILILAAGVMMNFLMAIFLFTISFWMGMPEWQEEIIITGVAEGSPAQNVGIKKDDIVFVIQGEEIVSSDRLQEIISENRGKEISMKVKREEGEIVTYSILARENPPDGQGALGIEMMSIPSIELQERASFLKGLENGIIITFSTTGEMFKGLFMVLQNIFTTGKSGEVVAGPVGIGQMVGKLIDYGISPLIQFSAILSLNFAVLNIFPFPALDGGRILFIFIELVTKKKVPARIEAMIHAAGLTLLMILLIFITYKDILRIIK